MTEKLDERKIIEALGQVATIDGNSNIVTAGAISGVVIKDGNVGFTIEINPKDKDKANQLRADAERAVLAINGVLSATALLTAHKAGPSMPTSGGPTHQVVPWAILAQNNRNHINQQHMSLPWRLGKEVWANPPPQSI